MQVEVKHLVTIVYNIYTIHEHFTLKLIVSNNC